MYKRQILITLLLVALLIASVAPVSHVQASEKILRYNLGSEPATIDPQASNRPAQFAVISALWRGLLRFDAVGNPMPSIAKEVPTVENGGISKDGKVYTFHLNAFQWSDGKGVVTAQDFVYSWRRLFDPALKNPYRTLLNGIVVNALEVNQGKKKPEELGISAVDEKTFQVTLVRPAPYFNQIVPLGFLSAVRKDNVERAGLPTNLGAWTDPVNGEAVGSGPFRIIKWDHNKEIVLERNPHFSGKLAQLDQVRLMMISDLDAALAAYAMDEVDITSIPASQYKSTTANAKISSQLNQYTIVCVVHFALDNTKPPFDKQKVREAFNYAFDRVSYVDFGNYGIGEKTLSFIPPTMPGYDPAAGNQLEFNPNKARQVLREAGYPDGAGLPAVRLNYLGNNPDAQHRAEWVHKQFHDVLNVDIELNPMDPAAYQAAISSAANRLPGMIRLPWCADFPHPAALLSPAFHSAALKNLTGFSDPTFDRLVDAADAEVNPQKAAELYKQAQEILLQRAPVIFINKDVAVQLVKPTVENLKNSQVDKGFPGCLFWEDIDLQS